MREPGYWIVEWDSGERDVVLLDENGQVWTIGSDVEADTSMVVKWVLRVDVMA